MVASVASKGLFEFPNLFKPLQVKPLQWNNSVSNLLLGYLYSAFCFIVKNEGKDDTLPLSNSMEL